LFVFFICWVIIIIIRPFLVITKMSSRFRALSAQVRRERIVKRTQGTNPVTFVSRCRDQFDNSPKKAGKWKEGLGDIQQPTRTTRLAQRSCVCGSVCRVFTLIVLRDQSVTSPTPCGSQRDRYITTGFLGFIFPLVFRNMKGSWFPLSGTTTCLPLSFKKIWNLRKKGEKIYMKSSLSKDSLLLIDKEKTEK